jgi:hypothetical protein
MPAPVPPPTDNVEDLVDELGTLSVVTLGPVVASTGLTEDEVVGTEELAEGTGADSVHGTGLQIDEDGTRNVLVAGSLWWDVVSLGSGACICCCLGVGFSYLVEVDVHALELEVGSTVVPVACQMDSLVLLYLV